MVNYMECPSSGVEASRKMEHHRQEISNRKREVINLKYLEIGDGIIKKDNKSLEISILQMQG